MTDDVTLDDAISAAEAEAAIHQLVEGELLGPDVLTLEHFGISAAPEGYVGLVMTAAQRQGLIEVGYRLRKAVEEISRAFAATTGAKDGARHG